MKIDLKGVDIYVNWGGRHIPQSISVRKEDLEVFCNELKKHKIHFCVEEKFLDSYFVSINADIVGYTNKERLIVKKWRGI